MSLNHYHYDVIVVGAGHAGAEAALAAVWLRADQLHPVEPREIAHARAVG